MRTQPPQFPDLAQRSPRTQPPQFPDLAQRSPRTQPLQFPDLAQRSPRTQPPQFPDLAQRSPRTQPLQFPDLAQRSPRTQTSRISRGEWLKALRDDPSQFRVAGSVCHYDQSRVASDAVGDLVFSSGVVVSPRGTAGVPSGKLLTIRLMPSRIAAAPKFINNPSGHPVKRRYVSN